MKFARLAILLSLASLVVGCDIGGKENNIAPEGPAKIRVGGSDVTVGGESGAGRPANLPADVPFYPGAILKIQVLTGSGDELSGLLQLRTPDSPQKVETYYRTELARQGWQVPTPTQADKDRLVAAITANKASRQIAVQIATDSQSGTNVALMLANKKGP